MNFLYIQAKESIYDIPWTLLDLKHTVTVLDKYEFDPMKENIPGYQAVENALKKDAYDFVISFLFFPKISILCEAMSIRYISWTYDSPLVSLFHPSIYNQHNYTFVFDHSEYEFLRKRNIPHLFYLPLAANLSRTGTLNITKEDEDAYSHDISFIGSLYMDNAYDSMIHLFPETLAMEFKLYLMQNLCTWHATKPWPHTSPKATEFIEQTLQGSSWNPWDIDNSLYFGMLILSRKLAQMDRITVLNTLAEHHAIDLYTNSDTQHLNNVQIHKGVDYYTDMVKVFYLSKINLNITLPSIETGIPQRIFDIMGSGGFVLTNYQADLENYFVIGKEIEVFHDLQELLEKTAYYLSHEKERIKIAMNGYKKVRKNHTYIHRITQILSAIQEAQQ